MSYKHIVAGAIAAGIAVHIGCGDSSPIPTGPTETPGISGKPGGSVGAQHSPNSPPSLKYQTRPSAQPGTPFPTVTGKVPFEVTFILCGSSDPNQTPDDQPTAGEGDTLNWQYHFGDDGSSPWNSDGSFNANAGQQCRVTHVYEKAGTYTATVSVTDKHLEDQAGDVAALARVSQQLTIQATGAGTGGGGGPSGPGTVCSSPGIAIPDPGAVTDSLVASGGALSDLNVSIVSTHTWVGDLIFTVQHVDTGTSVTVIDQPGKPASFFGCREDNINTVLDDASGAPVEDVCIVGTPTIDAGPYAPNNALAAFNGESLSGTWTMTVSDTFGGDAGRLDQWCLIGS